MADSVKASLLKAASSLPQDTARLDAEILLAYVLDKPRSFLYTWPDHLLSDEQANAFADLLRRNQEGEPVAYLVGYQEFWSMPFKVNSATLIPRPETEQLVDAVLADYPDLQAAKVWDAGTGSGAIALALKKEKPRWTITASDASFAALKVAQENSRTLNLPVQFVLANWLSPIDDASLDIIVSNPPYIAPNDQHLAELRYEPLSALVADDHGMADIDVLCQQAFAALKGCCRLYIEHGYDQEQAVINAFEKNGFTEVICHRDYAGLPRFTSGIKP